MELENIDKILIEKDRELDAVKIEQAGHEKQHDIDKKSFMLKITSLNDIVMAEKDSKDLWITRFEHE